MQKDLLGITKKIDSDSLIKEEDKALTLSDLDNNNLSLLINKLTESYSINNSNLSLNDSGIPGEKVNYIVPPDDIRIIYTGTWEAFGVSSSMYGNKYRRTNTIDSDFTFRFKGDKITVFAMTGIGCGKITVYLDESSTPDVVDIDLSDDNYNYRTPIYNKQFTSYADHTIRVKLTGAGDFYFNCLSINNLIDLIGLNIIRVIGECEFTTDGYIDISLPSSYGNYSILGLNSITLSEHPQS